MVLNALDSAELYERLDSEGLHGRIAALPDQVAQAWSAGAALELPPDYAGCDRIVVAGMGGSGVGGALLRSLAIALRARTPVFVVRGYDVPAFVDQRTLVFGCSNSGDTEETAAAFSAATAAGARCVAVTTGGGLTEIAREHRLPVLTYQWDAEPRSALGWSFASLLAICCRARLLPNVEAALRGALDEMRRVTADVSRDAPEASNAAKQLARRLLGKLPLFVGAEALAPVAYRWRTQVNENAKSWAIADELPEMNHNAQAGYGLPGDVLPLLHAVFLRQGSMHPRIRPRVDATIDEMRSCGVAAEAVDIAGDGVLAEMLCAIQLGDFVSYYLGLLNGVRPSPVEPLSRLKARLGRQR